MIIRRLSDPFAGPGVSFARTVITEKTGMVLFGWKTEKKQEPGTIST